MLFIFFLCVCVFFFGFSFTSLSSFFTHIETNQSVGGAKTGVPGEKPPDTPASRTWLVSHMNSCPVRGANVVLKDNIGVWYQTEYLSLLSLLPHNNDTASL